MYAIYFTVSDTFQIKNHMGIIIFRLIRVVLATLYCVPNREIDRCL